MTLIRTRTGAILAQKASGMRTLADLDLGESARLTQLLLPDDIAEIVSEAGFIPGAVVMLRNRAPGGGPCVYAVDGADIVIRREVAACIRIGEKS